MNKDLSRRLALGLMSSAMATPLIGKAFAQEAPSSSQTQPPRAVGQPFPNRVELPSTPQAEPQAGSIGIALVGLGYYALAKMAPAIAAAKGCHIAGLVSGNASKAARVASAYGLKDDAVFSYDRFDQIADHKDIDAIYIVLPSGLHADWTEKAFAAGKHVICEKPMALTSTECERMIAAGRAANKKLMIGYRCHFEPFNLKAMSLVREGAIGDVGTVRTDHHYVYGNATPDTNWRLNRLLAGGGPLEDFGIYGLQASLYLTGETPTSVSAITRQPISDARFSEVFSHVSSRFGFASGTVSQMATSYDAAFDDRVELRGSKRRLLMKPATGYGGQKITLFRGGNAVEIDAGAPQTQFRLMMEHFAAAVRDDLPLKTGGDMGLRDVRLMEAIYASAAQNRTLALLPDGRIKS